MTSDDATAESVEVICERCQRRFFIARHGVTLCECGVRHTFVSTEGV